MWDAIEADAKAWLDGARMSEELFRSFKVLVVSTPAVTNRMKATSATSQDNTLMITELAIWFAEMLKYFYPRSGDLTTVEFLLKYSSRFRRDSHRYMFMYQLAELGYHYVCPHTRPYTATPAKCVYSHGYTTAQLLKKFRERGGWAHLSDTLKEVLARGVEDEVETDEETT